LDTSPSHHNIKKPIVRSRGRLEDTCADIEQNHTYPTLKIQTLVVVVVVVVHATVPNPERRLEHSSREGSKGRGERGKGDVS
jgi:hypothetical protein